MGRHSDDCVRYPFENIPGRVFLDTNVINTLVKHAPSVFDGEPIPREADEQLATDIEALMHVFFVGARANWNLFGSQKVLDELLQTPDDNLRYEMLNYALALFGMDTEEVDRRFASDFGRKLIGTHFVVALPDLADRELIGNAIGYGCDTFCTRDRATIVKKRDQLRQISLRIMTPVEWWAHIKPWAGLWC